MKLGRYLAIVGLLFMGNVWAQAKPIQIYAPLESKSLGRTIKLPSLFYQGDTFQFSKGLDRCKALLSAIMKNLKTKMKTLPAVENPKISNTVKKAAYKKMLAFIQQVRVDRKLMKIMVEFLLVPSMYTFKPGIPKPGPSFIAPKVINPIQKQKISDLTNMFLWSIKVIHFNIDKVKAMQGNMHPASSKNVRAVFIKRLEDPKKKVKAKKKS